MHWIALLFAGIALVAAHLLRLPKRSSLIGGSAAFLTGLIITGDTHQTCQRRSWLWPHDRVDGFVNRAIEIAKQDDGPIILFTGASFSRNAIDDERLTLALRERGYRHRVINLSIEAASLFERDAHLKDFIARSPRAPEIVFVEVSEIFDKRPTFFFNNSKFSARGIEQFTLPVAWKTLRGLADGACHGAVDCLRKTVLVGSHTAVNFLNIGLLSQGDVTANVPPAPAFSALTEPREDMFTDEVRTGLATLPDVAPQQGMRWIASARDDQRTRLVQQDGVRSLAYYFPPVTDASARAYASGLCLGELAGFTCIIGDDPELLASLPPKYWADPGHLLEPGAEVYMNWLADRLIASGVLDGQSALRGSLDETGVR